MTTKKHNDDIKSIQMIEPYHILQRYYDEETGVVVYIATYRGEPVGITSHLLTSKP